jgi:hypothetical protein
MKTELKKLSATLATMMKSVQKECKELSERPELGKTVSQVVADFPIITKDIKKKIPSIKVGKKSHIILRLNLDNKLYKKMDTGKVSTTWEMISAAGRNAMKPKVEEIRRLVISTHAEIDAGGDSDALYRAMETQVSNLSNAAAAEGKSAVEAKLKQFKNQDKSYKSYKFTCAFELTTGLLGAVASIGSMIATGGANVSGIYTAGTSVVKVLGKLYEMTRPMEENRVKLIEDMNGLADQHRNAYEAWQAKDPAGTGGIIQDVLEETGAATPMSFMFSSLKIVQKSVSAASKKLTRFRKDLKDMRKATDKLNSALEKSIQECTKVLSDPDATDEQKKVIAKLQQDVQTAFNNASKLLQQYTEWSNYAAKADATLTEYKANRADIAKHAPTAVKVMMKLSTLKSSYKALKTTVDLVKALV